MTPAQNALRQEIFAEPPEAAASALASLGELVPDIRRARTILMAQQAADQPHRDRRVDDVLAMLQLDIGLSKIEIIELLGFDESQRQLYGTLIGPKGKPEERLVPTASWQSFLAVFMPPPEPSPPPPTPYHNRPKPYGDAESLAMFLEETRTLHEIGAARTKAKFARTQRHEDVASMASYLLAETALTPKEVRQLLGVRRKEAHLYPFLNPELGDVAKAQSVFSPESWRAIHEVYKRGPDPRLEMVAEQVDYIAAQWNNNPHWSSRQVLLQVNTHFAESWGNLELTQAGLRQLRKKYKDVFQKKPPPAPSKRMQLRAKFPPKSKPKDEITRLFLKRTKRPRIRSPYWRLRPERAEEYLQLETPLSARLTQFVMDQAHAGKSFNELCAALDDFGLESAGVKDAVIQTLRAFGYAELTSAARARLVKDYKGRAGLLEAIAAILPQDALPAAAAFDQGHDAYERIVARWPEYRYMLGRTHDHNGIPMFHRLPADVHESPFLNAVRKFLGQADVKEDLRQLAAENQALTAEVLKGSSAQDYTLIQAISDAKRLTDGTLKASTLEPLGQGCFRLLAAYLQQRGFFEHYSQDLEGWAPQRPPELPPPPSEAKVFTLIDRRNTTTDRAGKNIRRMQTRRERLHELPDAEALQDLSDNFLALRRAYLQQPRDERAIAKARAFFDSDVFKEKILPFAAVDKKYLLEFLDGKFKEWEQGFDNCSWDIPSDLPPLSAWQEETWAARRSFVKNRRPEMSRVPLIPADPHHDPLKVMEITRNHESYFERQPHMSRTRRSARAMKRLLKPGSYNAKLGGHVRKGALTAYAFYSVSLPQRETCGSSCVNWAGCYVDHMKDTHLAVPNADYRQRLEEDVTRLASDLRAQKRGLLLRMHPAGDFYSVQYVELLGQLLAANPNLAVWGLSQRTPSDHLATYLDVNQLMSEEEWRHHKAIGDALAKLQRDYPHQMFLHLSSPVQLPGTAFTSDINPHAEGAGPIEIKASQNAVWCLAEVGKYPDCAHCGVCFSRGTLRPLNGKAVLFTRHGRTPPNTANQDNEARQKRNRIMRRKPRERDLAND